MKNQNEQKGKKLNKRELRSITGGLIDCIDPRTGGCRIVSMGCAQLQCRPELPLID
jgi:hypothetical protein